jgi:tellurite resistance protein
MIEALERVFRQAERLSEQEQRELARIIEQKLSDMRWEELLRRPESAKFLRDLEREAEEESALEDLRPVR